MAVGSTSETSHLVSTLICWPTTLTTPSTAISALKSQTTAWAPGPSMGYTTGTGPTTTCSSSFSTLRCSSTRLTADPVRDAHATQSTHPSLFPL